MTGPARFRTAAIAAITAVATLGAVGALGFTSPDAPAPVAQDAEPSRLCVVWTSGDPDVAERVCFMYAHNAKKQGWFDEVHFIVWGPSQRLLAADEDLRRQVLAMQADGITVEACVACARSFGLVETIREMGIPVRGMGVPLSNNLKDGWRVITF